MIVHSRFHSTVCSEFCLGFLAGRDLEWVLVDRSGVGLLGMFSGMG